MEDIDKLVAQWGKEKPHLDTLPMAIFGRIMRLQKHIETQIAACHKQYGLTMGEFDVLATLRRSGDPYSLTPSALLSAMMLTSGAMTNRLDKLESKGLIERVHSKEDRRSVSVGLTELGFNTIDQAIEEHVKVQHQLVELLSEQQKPELNSLLKTWLTSFEP
ncbi:MarR family winged helix-turn-helix transcriptional regulator [Shewanella fidelis]|uniref:MarR family transcriptional regulator n=1 Tax=Shewanella fidelis TaxID=173509 RepID=A0AAW8NJ23_9GAMM|nr:MarR family transcriptional regulator [Shewanella fidelis]MDR8522255.1 MarR family transcriptional regulator [Shewanella fidelis]MDW4812529.1 MarR family transcriptional regulator [Shewanella fidelis]MDW4816276.1 MarR family transcriptional regulator [Shewanella fidelis]MDW4820770.1 MarR family transcriptional regulator [Shewanella fidelis]MDW4824992.1 MarR family transcriptional regulator [Shewanella fidelis]